MSIDDSALLHDAGRYDPQKAHEYYLRTRALKGRAPGAGKQSGGQRPAGSNQSGGGRPAAHPTSNAKMRPSRRKELLEQKAALEKRLDHLQEVLSQLVDAAKKRSGVDTTKDTKDKASTTKDSKSDKPLTEKQKRDKREASKKQYEAEKKMGLTGEVQQLQSKISDVLKDIKEAAATAERQHSSKFRSQAASNRR